MDISYRREPNLSRMIIKNTGVGKYHEERMIEENAISCLLPFSRVDSGDDGSTWYDISARKSIKNYFLQEGINAVSVYEALKSIKEGLDELSEFLIGPENILFSIETVFFRREEFSLEVGLAYCPGGDTDFAGGLASIGEYLIRNVDHDDKNAVSVCYMVFEAASRGEVTLPELILNIEPFIKDEIEMEKSIDSAVIEPEYDTGTFKGHELKPEEEKPPWFNDDEDIFEKPAKKKGLLASVFGERDKTKRKTKGKKEKNNDFHFEGYGSEIELQSIPEETAYYSDKTELLTSSPRESVSRRLVYEGKGTRQDMFIEKTPFLIGSNEKNCDGVISEGVISRVHARIVKQEDAYYIEDLESKNGTFLNGQILDFNNRKKLSLGDTISFANIGYRFM